MIKKFKIWLIHKLGGHVVEDWSPAMKNLFYQENVNEMIMRASKTIDEACVDILTKGFAITHYTGTDQEVDGRFLKKILKTIREKGNI